MWPAYLLVLICMSMPVSAIAFEQIESIDWGIRVAGIMPDYVDADFAAGVGLAAIYRHREFDALAVEADLITTVADGDIGGNDFSATTLAAYVSWRWGHEWYLKLRGGVLAEYVEVGPSDAFGSGLSGGVGAGWRRGRQLVEIELTGVEKAVYMISLAWYF